MTNRSVFIPGPGVNLVLLEAADAKVTHHWFNDRHITRYLSRGAWPMTEASSAAYYEKATGKTDQIVLGIWHKADNRLIGTVGLHDIDHLNQTAELGIVIGVSDYHNRGLGKVVVSALCEHAFSVLNLRNVTLRVLGNNPYAERCYTKCGFVRSGSLVAHRFKDGEWVDEVQMICYRELRAIAVKAENFTLLVKSPIT